MKWSVNKAAQEWSVERRTLSRALEGIGESVGKGATFHTQTICAALFGDLDREKLRIARADAEAKERENKVASGQLVAVDDAKKIITRRLAPIRSRLLSMASRLAARCNPTDPELARSEIDSDCRETLKEASE